MLIVKVLKPLVSTNRIPDFEHKHLQVVLDGSSSRKRRGRKVVG